MDLLLREVADVFLHLFLGQMTTIVGDHFINHVLSFSDVNGISTASERKPLIIMIFAAECTLSYENVGDTWSLFLVFKKHSFIAILSMGKSNT
jgi:hypothetical protein